MVLFCRRMDFWFTVRDCGGLCFMPTTEDVWHDVAILIDGLILAVRRLFMSILVWIVDRFPQHQTNKTVSSCFVYFYAPIDSTRIYPPQINCVTLLCIFIETLKIRQSNDDHQQYYNIMRNSLLLRNSLS